MLRRFRIAVSAFSLTACLVLIALWIRSYWRLDGIVHDRGPEVTAVVTEPGGIVFEKDKYPTAEVAERWTLISEPLPAIVPKPALSHPAFTWQKQPNWIAVYLPYSCLVLITAALALVPWVRWSRGFSLRTLLIATTLIAIAFGLIVWPR